MDHDYGLLPYFPVTLARATVNTRARFFLSFSSPELALAQAIAGTWSPEDVVQGVEYYLMIVYALNHFVWYPMLTPTCAPGNLCVYVSVCIRLLLDGGADPNATDEDRDTPLHYACSSGNMEIISMLLAKGADPTAADGLGRTPAERSTGPSVQALLEAESYKCEFFSRESWFAPTDHPPFQR